MDAPTHTDHSPRPIFMQAESDRKRQSETRAAVTGIVVRCHISEREWGSASLRGKESMRRSFGTIGSEGKHYLRISIATGLEDLLEATFRIALLPLALRARSGQASAGEGVPVAASMRDVECRCRGMVRFRNAKCAAARCLVRIGT
jgi:hypothetical protein